MISTLGRPGIFYFALGFLLLAVTVGLIFDRSGANAVARGKLLDEERLVSWETLPSIDGAACEWIPASASVSLEALQSTPQSEAVPPQPSAGAKERVSTRDPIYTIKDPHYAFAGIAVDPIRNEVVIAEENVSSMVVYDRLTNTPASCGDERTKARNRRRESFS